MASSSPSTFQLQTSTVRNSAPFQAKSADVFSSLDTMERDYNSTVDKRGIEVVGAKADDEKEAEEACIRRGCIFRKHPGSVAHAGSVSGTATQKAASSSSEARGGDRASSPSVRSDKGPSAKHSTTSSTVGFSAASRDNSFRKPDCGSLANVGRRWRGSSSPRSRHPAAADHVLNPHKYTEYSLEETNMCGNSANRSIALGFLGGLRKRKEQGDNQAVGESAPKDHFVFQKPKETGPLGQEERPAKTAYGSVYKMPEYEVGKASAPQPKKQKTSSLRETPDQTVEDEAAKPSARPVINLDPFENEQAVDKDDGVTQGVSRSGHDNPSGHVDNDEPEPMEATHHESGTFKSKQGKRKRHFRGRQEDT